MKRQGITPIRRQELSHPDFLGNEGEITGSSHLQPTNLGSTRPGAGGWRIWVACLLFEGNLGKLKKSSQGLRPFAELLLRDSGNTHSVADLKSDYVTLKMSQLSFFDSGFMWGDSCQPVTELTGRLFVIAFEIKMDKSKRTTYLFLQGM